MPSVSDKSSQMLDVITHQQIRARELWLVHIAPEISEKLDQIQPKTILTQRWSSLEVLEGVPLSNVSGGREGLCRPKKK